MEHISQTANRVMSELASKKKQIFPGMTKATIQKRLSWMLKNYPGGTILQGFDKKLVLAVLDNHPNVIEKKGCGVEEIGIVDDGKRGKHYEVQRIDGSRIDFSYRTALRGSQKQLAQFQAACRTAIISDIREFRGEALKSNPVCRHRGIPLDWENSVVDHVKPKTFNMLVANFISSHDLDIDQIEIGGETQRVLLDANLAYKWRCYHRDNAVLELVYYEANNAECR